MSESESTRDENLEKVKNIFAPAQGLERSKEGKLTIDKEKVEVKEEPAFEEKKENLVKQELESIKANPNRHGVTSAISQKSSTPAKAPRMTLAER